MLMDEHAELCVSVLKTNGSGYVKFPLQVFGALVEDPTPVTVPIPWFLQHRGIFSEILQRKLMRHIDGTKEIDDLFYPLVRMKYLKDVHDIALWLVHPHSVSSNGNGGGRLPK
jgi:hypothetical protein